jgi:multiple sugar transport system permease protein
MSAQPTLRSIPRPDPRKDPNRPSLTSRWVVMLVLVISTVYFLMPLWWMVMAAIKPAGRQFESPGMWFNGFDLFGNIADLFTLHDGVFGRWMINSILYAGVSTVIGTLLSAMAGYALAKYRFRGRGVAFGVILSAVMIPKVMFTLPLFLMFNEVGLLNNPLAVVLPSVVSPFGVYLARVFAVQAVPDEVVEAARIDGASEVKIFFRVAVPMMGPALVTIFLFQFVEVWNNYLLPLMVLNDSSLQPVTVGLVAWAGSNGQLAPAGTVIVGAFVSILPLIIAFLSLQRFWRAGLTAGAIK